MGFLREKSVGKLGVHQIEVWGENNILRGLLYTLILDGKRIGQAQNFFKLPTRRTIEAKAVVDGTERHFIVKVKQNWLNTDYALTIDGEAIPLMSVG